MQPPQLTCELMENLVKGFTLDFVFSVLGNFRFQYSHKLNWSKISTSGPLGSVESILDGSILRLIPEKVLLIHHPHVISHRYLGQDPGKDTTAMGLYLSLYSS